MEFGDLTSLRTWTALPGKLHLGQLAFVMESYVKSAREDAANRAAERAEAAEQEVHVYDLSRPSPFIAGNFTVGIVEFRAPKSTKPGFLNLLFVHERLHFQPFSWYLTVGDRAELTQKMMEAAEGNNIGFRLRGTSPLKTPAGHRNVASVLVEHQPPMAQIKFLDDRYEIAASFSVLAGDLKGIAQTLQKATVAVESSVQSPLEGLQDPAPARRQVAALLGPSVQGERLPAAHRSWLLPEGRALNGPHERRLAEVAIGVANGPRLYAKILQGPGEYTITSTPVCRALVERMKATLDRPMFPLDNAHTVIALGVDNSVRRAVIQECKRLLDLHEQFKAELEALEDAELQVYGGRPLDPPAPPVNPLLSGGDSLRAETEPHRSPPVLLPAGDQGWNPFA